MGKGSGSESGSGRNLLWIIGWGRGAGPWAIDESAVKEACGAEVEEEAAPVACGFEIVDDLGVFDGADGVEGFEFDDDGAEAQEVGAVDALEVDAFVGESDEWLALIRDVAQPKLDGERVVVDGFEEAGAERGVDFHRRADDRVGLRIIRESKVSLLYLHTHPCSFFQVHFFSYLCNP